MKKTLVCFTLFLILSACGLSETAETMDAMELKDIHGRTVEVPRDTARHVAVGPGALRLYSYIGDPESIVGIEAFETNNPSAGRPYTELYLESSESLPQIGSGGPKASLNPEAIMAAGPEIIFVSDHYDEAEVSRLQKDTMIPVITITSATSEGSIFSDTLYESFKLIGEATGNSERGKAVVSFMKDTKEDLHTRSLEASDAKELYLGCLPKSGIQGIASTSGDYDLLDTLHIENIARKAGIRNHAFIDKEQLLLWDPEHIVIDANGYGRLQDDMKDSGSFYSQLSAFKNGQVHMQMPYNFYSTNIELALANAYFIGSVMHPESFSDIDPKEKTDTLSRFFLGVEIYEELEKTYSGGFQSFGSD